MKDTVGELPKANAIWNEEAQPLQDDEELDFDSAAYEMLHRSAVEWPCLSIDVIVKERCGGPTGILDKNKWFPSQMGGLLGE